MSIVHWRNSLCLRRCSTGRHKFHGWTHGETTNLFMCILLKDSSEMLHYGSIVQLPVETQSVCTAQKDHVNKKSSLPPTPIIVMLKPHVWLAVRLKDCLYSKWDPVSKLFGLKVIHEAYECPTKYKYDMCEYICTYPVTCWITERESRARFRIWDETISRSEVKLGSVRQWVV